MLEKYVSKYKEIFRKTGSVYNSLVWTGICAITFASSAGVGNGLGYVEECKRFDYGFGEAYCASFKFSLAFAPVRAITTNLYKKSKHIRLYANLTSLVINAAFLCWNYYNGVKHPIQATTPNVVLGLIVANQQVSNIKSLEERID